MFSWTVIDAVVVVMPLCWVARWLLRLRRSVVWVVRCAVIGGIGRIRQRRRRVGLVCPDIVAVIVVTRMAVVVARVGVGVPGMGVSVCGCVTASGIGVTCNHGAVCPWSW